MRRKRSDAAEFELITGISTLFLVCFWLVPAFHFPLTAGLIVFACVAIGFAIYCFVFHEPPHVENTNRIISINNYQPNSAPALAPKSSAALSTIAHASPRPQPAPLESLSERLRKIDWYQFEKLVAAIYQAKGFSVQRLGGAKPDGGVDLIIERNGQKTAVQCKHWKSDVPVSNIREFLGALKDQEFQNGIFITLTGYTSDARAFAAKHNIQLLGRFELTTMLDEADWRYNPAIQSALDPTKKLCPKCEREMVLRTARKGRNPGGQFWACPTYRCGGTLNCA